MDPTTLKIFCVVADELNMTRAAQRLSRAQSNVTTRIQQLERSLDATLFVRQGKMLSLSEQGETFLPYARALVATAEEARQAVHPGTPRGPLRIGSMESTAASRLPPVLAAFNRRWPEVSLKVRTGASRPLVSALADRALDAALVALPLWPGDMSSYDAASLRMAGRAVFQETLMLVRPAGARERTLSLAAFPEGCSYRAAAQHWFASSRRAGGAGLDIQDVPSYHAMLACVASGGCFSVMPASMLALLSVPQGVETAPLYSISTWLLWREGFRSAALRAFEAALGADDTAAPGAPAERLGL
ncbi:LysR substrate-binding domain-containing protein [Chitinasiproducens palmae]|uniref:DNA-binding transcriptional regulator, LysR family n=1 Tax=Chitinasiproducens palmae TaxID=1770053 RepID=A0A1H2PIA9_9BURK|nr:LysR substrate-binding domain-containing protein [Chitinasiproducens palmae]SDV46019.1 DNA-binding transcriptional regulator, LysR family [Chitinasiproducens palmae]